MKKILLVTIDFPPVVGGVSHYLSNLCQQFDPAQIVVLTSPHIDSEKFDQQQKYKIIRKNLGQSKLIPNWLIWYWQIKKIIKQEKIDLLWAGQILPVGTLCYWLSKLTKISYWLFTYGMDIILPQKQGGRKLTLAKKIVQSASQCTTISSFTRQQLVKLGASDSQINLVYPCAHVTPERNPVSPVDLEALRSRYQLKEQPVIVSAGRLQRRKGFDVLLKSLPVVSAQVPDVKLVIIGDGQDKDRLKNLTQELGLVDQVIFTDQLPDQELANWLQLSDLFVMLPRQLKNGDAEGFGIVYLEANLFNKPVIGTRSGGVPDAIAEDISGLLVRNPRDQKEVAAKIIKLLTNQALAKKLGQQGYYRATNEFTWVKQAEKLKNLL